MYVYRAHIENGHLPPHTEEEVRRAIALNDGKDIVITIKRWKPQRSGPQNNLYWAYLTLIAEWSGHHPNELHAIFKAKFLPKRFTTFNNEEVELPPSTSLLTVSEFTSYLRQIEADTSIPIPEGIDLS